MANQTVRYTGQAGIRKISAADFKSVGVEDQNQIEVAGRNLQDAALAQKLGNTVEVSEAAAKYLTEKESFELVDNQPPSSSSADQGEGDQDDQPAKGKSKGK